MKKIFILICLTVLIGAVFTACERSDTAVKPDDVDYYTCTMHPTVRAQKPGDKCPICGMRLVPVKKKMPGTNVLLEPPAHVHGGESAHAATNAPQTSEFVVSPQRQQLIGVTYATVGKKVLQRKIRAAGVVTNDKQRHWDYVARVEGYVQKLGVFSRGETVTNGQAILNLYSPDLLTTQNEFLDVLRLRDEAKKSNSDAATDSADRMLESARRRLRLWNIDEAQLVELEKTRQPKENLTLISPVAGVVQDLPVDQGRKVMPGDHLVDVVDLSVVWVWAEFYQNEIGRLKKGLAVTISTAAYPREKFHGKIAVIDLFLNEVTRTARVRIAVDNQALKLRPEMFVDVEVAWQGGEGLVIPVSAVLPGDGRTLAFLDKGEGRIEPRFIEIGEKFGNDFQLLSGLKEGDRIVNSANFLIDAESKVQGAVKAWNAGSTE
jgi:Cu(I)/Ag(I) efflux system membrane fusion protein